MADVTDAVREDRKTELSRLGSSKALYAVTGGEMDDETVLARAADLFEYAADRFDDWGADAAGPADLYAEAAAVAEDYGEDAASDLEDYAPGEEPAVDAVLGSFADPAPRLGALVGWTLVAGKTAEQLTGYFVGQADPQTADDFRSAGDAIEDLREQALDALADRDDADADGADAVTGAADAVVEAAYDEYFETLESLGVNPKPVC